MKVNFYATLRDVTGQKTVDFEIAENATVRQLVDAIVARYPLLRQKMLQENGALHGYVHVFINGRDIPFLVDRMETAIKPGDVISVFPAVGGG